MLTLLLLASRPAGTRMLRTIVIGLLCLRRQHARFIRK